MMRRVILLVLAAILVFSLFSCGKDNEKSEYLHTYCEIAFDLPISFISVESQEFDALFTDGEAFLGITRLSFVATDNSGVLNGSMFPDAVARSYAESQDIDVNIIDEESYSYFVCTEGGYYNQFVFYRSKYAHFVVRFMCASEKESKYAKAFMKYAREAIFTQ